MTVQKRYSPIKEISLFLLIWPISAIALCILTLESSFFCHFRSDLQSFLSTAPQILKVLLFLPYVMYKFVESIFFAMDTLATGSDNFWFNLLIQFDKYCLMFGWIAALGVFYLRYYKNCCQEQSREMKYLSKWVPLMPIIIVVICALLVFLYLR